MMKRDDTEHRGINPIKKIAGAGILASVMATGAFAQPEDPEIGSMHVAANIWVIYGAGGNVTVQYGEDGIFVVDTTFEETAPAVLEEIRRLEGFAMGRDSELPLRYVINTHSHGDHVGGNAIFHEAGEQIVAGNEAGDVQATTGAGAEIIGHENVQLRMALSDEDIPFEQWPTEVYLGQQYDLYFNDEPIELLYQGNAHTDNDTMVFFRKSDVISTGDVYFTESYPFIDASIGGHINGVIDSLNQIISITVPEGYQEGGTMVIPGHGRLGDEADVVDYRDMITIIRDRIQYYIDEGMSLQEVIDAEPTLDYDGRYGQGFVSPEDFITVVYNGLSEDMGDM